jgi:alpha-1,2-mannosyltransferase
MAVLGLAGGLGAVVGGWRTVATVSSAERLGIVVCALAVSTSAWTISYLHEPSDDYRLYELAARDWAGGASLYAHDGHNQLPLPSLLLGRLRTALAGIGTNAPSDDLWRLTYFAYQFTQLLFVIIIIAACHALAVRAGSAPERADVIAGVTVAFAFPLREALGNNQLNVPVLALALGALALVGHRPIISGVLVAVGGALKLYPLAFLLPWWGERRWRALLTASATLALLIIALWPHWVEFAAFVRRTEVADAYRHVGLHAVLMNTTRDALTATGTENWRPVAQAVWLVSVLAVGGWATWLVFAERQQLPDPRRSALLASRILAMVVIVFPLAWAHHVVFVLPLAVCLWAPGTPKPVHVIGTVLALFVPAFDIYPLGIHRLLGVFLLVTR